MTAVYVGSIVECIALQTRVLFSPFVRACITTRWRWLAREITTPVSQEERESERESLCPPAGA